MNILLTGATGFLGSHLLHALISLGHKVTILKRTTSNINRIRDVISCCHIVDIDVELLESAFSANSIEVAIHTACTYGRKGEPYSELVETNILFPIQLMQLCIEHGVKAFFNSDTMLPSYLNAYSLSKHQFFEWLELNKEEIKIFNMKIEHMYGPDDDKEKFLEYIMYQLQQNKPFINLTKGIQLRDFIHVDDVVSAFLTVLSRYPILNNFITFQVGTGCSRSIVEVVDQLYSMYTKLNPTCQTQLRFGAVPFREGEAMEIHVDISALRALGWAPQISLEQGLQSLLLGKGN